MRTIGHVIINAISSLLIIIWNISSRWTCTPVASLNQVTAIDQHILLDTLENQFSQNIRISMMHKLLHAYVNMYMCVRIPFFLNALLHEADFSVGLP